MKVDVSNITGETGDIVRIVKMENGKAVGDRSHNIFEAINVGFCGAKCTAGHGKGLVFMVGESTVYSLT